MNNKSKSSRKTVKIGAWKEEMLLGIEGIVMEEINVIKKRSTYFVLRQKERYMGRVSGTG